MARLEAKAPSTVAEHIKLVARRLFAERGVDGVTVREIAEFSGQKNHAAVGYHFGSKEALVREIILDGAKLINERREKAIDEMEARGGPQSVREIVDLLINSSINLGGAVNHEDTYIRFITMLNMTHRDLFLRSLEGRWNSGYLRCLDHMRRLMPELSHAIKNQRFIFMGPMLSGVLAMREAGLTDKSRGHPTWRSPLMLVHFASAMTSMLQAPLDPALGELNGESIVVEIPPRKRELRDGPRPANKRRCADGIQSAISRCIQSDGPG